jgi:outer membrane biosynthesis protein TonB
MYLATILAAVLLSPISFGGMTGRNAACRASGRDKVQAATANENPQATTTDPAPKKGAEQKPPESKPDETPSVVKADEPIPQKPPASQPKVAARKRSSRSKKPVTPPTAENEPRKIVIHQGGTSEPVAQILPGISPEEANRQRESAERLLDAAESSLQQLVARSLHPRQQDTVVQIRQYIDRARSALKESDPQRAHTLAQKAYLLSDDLAKHK